MPKLLDNIQVVSERVRGASGAPLSYVVHVDPIPSATANDLSANYSSLDEEMIAMAPIIVIGTAGNPATLEVDGPFDNKFKVDNAKVWEILHTILQDTQV